MNRYEILKMTPMKMFLFRLRIKLEAGWEKLRARVAALFHRKPKPKDDDLEPTREAIRQGIPVSVGAALDVIFNTPQPTRVKLDVIMPRIIRIVSGVVLVVCITALIFNLVGQKTRMKKVSSLAEHSSVPVSVLSVKDSQTIEDLRLLAEEWAYFEGQKDALTGTVRIAKKDSAWVWTRNPWDDDTVMSHIRYRPELGQLGSLNRLLKK